MIASPINTVLKCSQMHHLFLDKFFENLFLKDVDRQVYCPNSLPTDAFEEVITN